MAEEKEKGFYFGKLRGSADNKRRVVLSGYAVDGYLEEVKPRAAVFVGNKPAKALKCELELVKLPPINVRRRDGHAMSYLGIFYVDMEGVTEKLAETKGAKLVIIVENTEKKRNMIYKGSLEKAFATMKSFSYNVQEAYVSNGRTQINGWLAGDEDTIIKIEGIRNSDSNDNSVGVDGTARVGSSDTTGTLDYQIDRYSLSEISLEFPECPRESNLGFRMSVEGEYKKVRVTMTNGDKTKSRVITTGKSESELDGSGTISRYSEKIMRNIRNYGVQETLNKVRVHVAMSRETSNKKYNKWIHNLYLTPEEHQEQKNLSNGFNYKPLLSLLVPLYETDERFLDELIQSIKRQNYDNWEICFSDGSKDPTRLRDIIAKYTAEDPRIKYIAEAEGPLGISSNTNQAYQIAEGEFIVLGDHDDLIAPDAFYECVKALNDDVNSDQIDVIYTDEDKTNSAADRRFEPAIKPNFNLQMLESCNYITHMFVVRKSLVEEVGLFDDECNGAQDYDFILRCTEKARRIHHVNKILYSWRINETSTAGNPAAKMYAYDSGVLALQKHYDRMGIPAKAEIGDHLGYYHTKYEVKGDPIVYVVVTSADDKALYEKTVKSFKAKSQFKNMEFIRVKPDGNATLSFQLNRGFDEVETLVNATDDIDANDVYIMYVEAGVTMVGEDGISSMLGYITNRSGTGAIGGKIYCSNGTHSHAGVILHKDLRGDGKFINHTIYKDLYYNYAAFSALKNGVVMFSLQTLRENGEFSGRFKGSYTIIDYTYLLTRRGLTNVYDANAAFQIKSSRGNDFGNIVEDPNDIEEDQRVFDKKYSEILSKGDIYYSLFS